MTTYKVSNMSEKGISLNIYKQYMVFRRHGRVMSFWEKGAPQPELPDKEGEVSTMNVWQLLIALGFR